MDYIYCTQCCKQLTYPHQAAPDTECGFAVILRSLSYTTNVSNSKSEKRKCGDLVERLSDMGRELRRAVTPFSSFQLCNKFAVQLKSRQS